MLWFVSKIVTELASDLVIWSVRQTAKLIWNGTAYVASGIVRSIVIAPLAIEAPPQDK